MGEHQHSDRRIITDRLEWTAHPASERPWATLLLSAIIFLAGVTAGLAMQNLWWGVVGMMLLLLTMWNYYLPQQFVIDSEGVRKKSLFGLEKRPWKEIRSIYTDRYGVLLSPFNKPSRLAKFRGLSVQFSHGNREKVLDLIRRMMQTT